MSWSGDSDNAIIGKSATEQWKTQMAKIEQIFLKITQLTDTTRKKFQMIKTNRSDSRNIENEIASLNRLIYEVSDEIIALEKLVNTSNYHELNTQKFMIKDLRRRAADQTKIVRELCTNINLELQERSIRRKKEISITSHELDFNEDSMRHSEQMTIDDSQIKIAIDEQKQMEKLTRDVIQLEEMFVKLNGMVHEQGEMVDRIEMNVEEAYEKVDLGGKELDKAVNYKRSAMRKKLCIIGIVVGVLLVIALIIGLAVGIKN